MLRCAACVVTVVQVQGGLTSVAISPDGQLVAAGSPDGVVWLWDVQSWALIKRLRGHKKGVCSVVFTPDGKGLMSGSWDRTLKHWDLRPLLSSPERTLPLLMGLLPEELPLSPPGELREQSEKGCTCTLTLKGHMVRRVAREGRSPATDGARRTKCYRWRCRTTTSGSCRDRRTNVWCSGTCARVKRSACCKGTRIQVSGCAGTGRR